MRLNLAQRSGLHVAATHVSSNTRTHLDQQCLAQRLKGCSTTRLADCSALLPRSLSLPLSNTQTESDSQPKPNLHKILSVESKLRLASNHHLQHGRPDGDAARQQPLHLFPAEVAHADAAHKALLNQLLHRCPGSCSAGHQLRALAAGHHRPVDQEPVGVLNTVGLHRGCSRGRQHSVWYGASTGATDLSLECVAQPLLELEAVSARLSTGQICRGCTSCLCKTSSAHIRLMLLLHAAPWP